VSDSGGIHSHCNCQASNSYLVFGPQAHGNFWFKNFARTIDKQLNTKYRLPSTAFYLGTAGAGHSGWQVPVVPLRPKQQPQGRLQMSPLAHGLPQATTALVDVLNW
jgi:hypothetical protein